MPIRKFCIVVNRPSDSAKELAVMLDALRLKPERLHVNKARAAINWGCTVQPTGNKRVLNPPEAVAVAVNKLKAFKAMQARGVNIPPFTEREPKRAFPEATFLARKSLTGSGGDGIVVVRRNDDVPPAPLYVLYMPKKFEYRVHVVGGKAIFMQQKRKKNNAEQTKDQALIRNHENGWVFAENVIDLPARVTREAIAAEAVKAVAALGLDFGAVDLIVPTHEPKPVILEVNTAPGMESTQLKEAYKNAFAEYQL